MVNSELIIVHSKLLVPDPTSILHRPRICQTIEEGLERKLTLVSAPAGYGKTSALVDFARHSPVPVCWYTADERDCDLRTFIEYLVGAVGERFPCFGQRTQKALTSQARILLHDPTIVVGDLVNEMLDLDASFVLVVDSYETLDGVSDIQEFVNRFLEVLPQNCHLMLGSRTLPQVPVAHLIAKRQLVGLAEQDLCFEPREIHKLLHLLGNKISESQAEMLAASTEGWVTGVLLLTWLLHDETETTSFSTERATAQTYDHLVGEILKRQPAEVRRFLCASAVLREMSPRLCREVLQIDSTSALLEEVKRRNLFVACFGKGAAAAYRYHSLFHEFLRGQLHRQDSNLYVELHHRAAEWFEREDDAAEAVCHYLAAGAYPEAAALMEQVAGEWFAQGRVETLLHWAKELSGDTRTRTPLLSLCQSKVLAERYDYDGARRALVYAEAGFAASEDITFLAQVHSQRAALALFEGHYEETIVEAQTALEMMGQDETIERAEAQWLVGKACVQSGHLTGGILRLENALALYRQADSSYDVIGPLQDLALALADLGCLDQAEAHLNEALSMVRRSIALVRLGSVLNNLGWLSYIRGEYRKALILYQEGLIAAQRESDLWHQVTISVGLANIYRDVGSYDRASSLYDAARKITRDNELALAFYILAAEANMYRWQGNYSRALALLGQARRLAKEKGLDFEVRGVLSVAEGIALAESGEVETGLFLLSNAADFLEQRQARRDLAWTHFLMAKAYLLLGNEPQAAVELRQAMEWTDESGAYQFAVVEGQHVEELLEFGIAEGLAACQIVLEKVQELRAFGKELGWGRAELQEDLTDRLEIYALGGGQVVRGGRPLSSSEWETSLARELFFHVLLNGPLRRDVIGLAFWPDLPAKKVRNNFHVTLHRVRSALGANAVVAENRQYRVGDVEYWFDVEEFEALVERAQLLPLHDRQAENLWRRAVALYQGDLLIGVERAWCIPKREALRRMYFEALVRVGRCHEVRREFEKAVEWYRRALEVNPLRDDVRQRMVRCCAEAGLPLEMISDLPLEGG